MSTTITDKTAYGSGKVYTPEYEADSFPMFKDAKEPTEEEITALMNYIKPLMVTDNQIGYLKGGYQFNIATEKLTDQSDLGEMKVDLITKETGTVTFGLFNSNTQTIGRIYPTAKYKAVGGYGVTTVGGLGDMDASEKLVIFHRIDNKKGDTICVCRGKNTSGFDRAFKNDAVTPFAVNFECQPLDEKGNIYIEIDCPAA
ncbi:MAG: hypothetical protein ACI4KF_02575 [Huintestinicola sp.]